MTAIDTNRALAGARPSGNGFSLWSVLTAWGDARRTRNALYQLSDHQLRDIGLSRSDIEKVVRRD